MKDTVLNKALSAAFVMALGVSLSACSGGEGEHESHEVLAKDRVDEAAELAIQNGPEAEKMEFPEAAPVAETDAAADGTATDEAATTDADSAGASMTETSTTTETDAAAGADSADADPAADTTPAAE